MGVEYLAVDEELSRRVALEVMSPGLLTDEHAVERFRDEARAMARLTHPNIVPTYDVGEAGGLHYLEMACVAGRSPAEILGA